MRLLKRESEGNFIMTANILRSEVPAYAILSHTWEDDEVTFEDFRAGTAPKKKGYRKIVFCGNQAAKHGLQYFWVDSLCIDKSSSAELTEAINSMFRWYYNSARCYVYLSDVSTTGGTGIYKQQLVNSRWFTRGWTLQELLAPRSVEFFSCEEEPIGDQQHLQQEINQITGIPGKALQGTALSLFTVTERMEWAKMRQTTIEEDRAYCLLGIFGVSMPVIYGEGYERALRRLRKEIHELQNNNESDESRAEPTISNSRKESMILRESIECKNKEKEREEKEREELIESLSFDHIEVRENTIKRALEHTCDWLLACPKYQDWLNVTSFSEHHGLLWIKGKPGVGKSTLMKFAYAHARKVMQDAYYSIAFFFNARGSTLEKNTIGLFRSLLYQIFRLIPKSDWKELLDGVTPLALPRLSSWSLEVLMDLLALAIPRLGNRTLQIYVDALDECNEDEVREMLSFFEKLGNSAFNRGARLLVCFSSRHYPRITAARMLEMVLEEENQHTEDINFYIRSQLRAGQSEAIRQIRAEVLFRSAGIFLWVVIVIRLLNKAYDYGHLHALREKLKEIPNDLSDLFRSILGRDNQNVEEMKACILWVLFATRPLTKQELYYAILSATRPKQIGLLVTMHVPEDIIESMILSSSKGLTELTSSASPTVQFIHESVRDFLLSDHGKLFLWDEPRIDSAQSGHQLLKDSCWSYYQAFLCCKQRPSPVSWPFLDYVILNLFKHSEDSIMSDAEVNRFLRELFEEEYERLCRDVAAWGGPTGVKFKKYSTPLYIMAVYNCPKLIRSWLSLDTRKDPFCYRLQSPLFVALKLRNKAAIRALLTPVPGRGSLGTRTDLSGPPTDSQLDEAINFYKNWNHRPPLLFEWSLSWLFLREASDQVALAILRSGHFDLSLKDPEHQRTLLSYAAERGLVEVVRFLLEVQEALPEFNVINGFTRIPERSSFASTTSNLKVNRPAERAPLWYAAHKGHTEVIKLLIKCYDVDINCQDERGRTPLIEATSQGHEKVVNALLNAPYVDIDCQDIRGQTAMDTAIYKGYDLIVKLLLETGNVDINRANNRGKTPISLASAQGNIAIVKLILDIGNVNVNIADVDGRTPVFLAAEQGHAAVVKLLLDTSDVNINFTDAYGQTPDSVAAKHGHFAVIQLLAGSVLGNKRTISSSSRHSLR